MSDPSLQLDVENPGIYVHVPFCETLCPFCPYFKEPYSPVSMERFQQSLIREIEAVGKMLLCPSRLEIPEAGHASPATQGDCARPKAAAHTGCGIKRTTVESVYFGGGSPSLMGDGLVAVAETLRRYFDITGGIGVELHPKNVNEQTIRHLKTMSCNMVSLGVQSFHPKLLETLERKPSDEERSLQMLADASFDVIDVDLIFGIPEQTPEQLAGDFRQAVGLGATQISTYPFIDFSFASNKRKPQGHAAKKRMLQMLVEMSKQCGFERTSVWTFARKEMARYSSITRDNYLGFGPSAATLLRKTFRVNTFSVDEYCRAIDGGTCGTTLALHFTTRQRMVYWLFWSCYNLIISRQSFRRFFHCDLDDVFRYELWAGRLLGYLMPSPDGYLLTERGALAFHRVEQHYTLQYIDRMWCESGKTPWPTELIIS
ncbi:MAG: radical SAM protein [Planctomycetaceae bacterium]|nr:radical SAM protein [Planctomycetaceae bacterium]